MSNLKIINRLLTGAKKCETESNWNMAIITYKEIVNLCRHTVNEQLTSDKMKQKVMDITIQCIERCERIENYQIFQSEKKHVENDIQTTNERQINVNQKLDDYFKSDKGGRHNDEQIKCIKNIAMLINVSRPRETLQDVFGLKGKLR